ncbi:MAG TPA: hypothetical protein VGR62_13100 [Candidatus Binatia bacterium]|jgi:hypothetical protein|nr:hypothetical protein [Candidatus Binatia bacterium]
MIRSLARATLVVGFLLAAVGGVDAANCTKPAGCSVAAFTNDASCCFGLYCQLDGDVVLSGPNDCTLDFGNRDVTISGKVQLGTRRLKIRAKSLVISNGVDGRGAANTRGGTLEVETFVGTALDFRLLTNAAKIDLSGGLGGGVFSLDAKGGASLEQGEIRADGLTATAAGGSIALRSETGNIHVGTTLSADDGTGTGGGSSLIDLQAPGGAITLNGANISAAAGSIDIAARDAVSSDQGAKLRTDRGGAIDITGGVLTLAGENSATFGSINLHATAGALAVTRTSQPGLRVDASTDGDTGEISLVADAPGTAGTITIATPIVAPGADVEVQATGLLRVTKKLNASGTPAGGGDTTGAGQVVLESELLDIEITDDVLSNDNQTEGSVDLIAGHDVLVDGGVEAKGTMGGPGGAVTISAGRNVRVGAGRTVDASGGESGGSVEVRAGGDVELVSTSRIDAGTGSPGPGGVIDLAAGADGEAGSITIAGSVVAKTKDAGFSPSVVLLEGCDVTIAAAGTVDSNRLGSNGENGSNTFTARKSVTVSGKVLGGGGNFLTSVASPAGGGQVTPSFTVSLRPACTGNGVPAGCLLPCPTCGDGQKEFPETCDEGAADRCSSKCGPTCRTDLVCDAALQCAGVACDTVAGCYFGPVPQGTTCNDGNACTPTDVCSGGSCIGSGTTVCSDGNACNGVETCVAPGGCQAGTPLTCNDGNACTNDGCAPATGCQFVPNAEPCDDGDTCTVNDACGNSACQAGSPLACGPGEICVEPTGCENAPACDEASDCNDGNACNGVEACVNQACVPGTPVVCNDGDVCNGLETCVPATGACLAGVACDDGNACNGVETCSQATGCHAGTPPTCADADVCTSDTCNPLSGCVHAPVGGDCCNLATDCTDADICTDATCVAHTCVFETSALCCTGPADCADGNPCTTDDVCNDDRCEHTLLEGTQPGCGDACTPGACDAGSCIAGDPTVCDDGELCTDDTCDPSSGCVFTDVGGCCEGNAGCDDDAPCTVDTCDTDTHTCSHVVDEMCSECLSDSDCDPLGQCGGMACTSGVCVATPPLACDDGNQCTVDTCPNAGGCVHTVRSCDDGRACNGGESCSPIDGCRAGTVPNCDDGDRCTDDACAEPTGCTHVQRTGFPGVVCQLDTVAAFMDGASVEELTVKQRRKLGKLLTKVRATLRKAEATGSARKRSKLAGKATSQLRGLAKAIDKGRERGIAGDLADVLRRAVDGAATTAGTLR